jgi:hypothetical protein
VIEPKNKLETGAPSTVAGDLSIVTKAASSEARVTERARINPDDLHDLFEGSLSGDLTDEEDPLAQLRNDPNYAALIRDLESIAQAARELFATQDEAPSDKVWDGIQKELGKKSEEQLGPE